MFRSATHQPTMIVMPAASRGWLRASCAAKSIRNAVNTYPQSQDTGVNGKSVLNRFEGFST